MNKLRCDECGQALSSVNVERELKVPNQRGLWAFMLRCHVCHEVTRAIGSKEELDQVDQDREFKKAFEKKLILEAQRELEEAESILWMREVWSKNPPLREEVMRACQCPSCRSRVYVEP